MRPAKLLLFIAAVVLSGCATDEPLPGTGAPVLQADGSEIRSLYSPKKDVRRYIIFRGNSSHPNSNEMKSALTDLANLYLGARDRNRALTYMELPSGLSEEDDARFSGEKNESHKWTEVASEAERKYLRILPILQVSGTKVFVRIEYAVSDEWESTLTETHLRDIEYGRELRPSIVN